MEQLHNSRDERIMALLCVHVFVAEHETDLVLLVSFINHASH